MKKFAAAACTISLIAALGACGTGKPTAQPSSTYEYHGIGSSCTTDDLHMQQVDIQIKDMKLHVTVQGNLAEGPYDYWLVFNEPNGPDEWITTHVRFHHIYGNEWGETKVDGMLTGKPEYYSAGNNGFSGVTGTFIVPSSEISAEAGSDVTARYDVDDEIVAECSTVLHKLEAPSDE